MKISKEELIELYNLFEEKILKNKYKFNKQRYKDDELIQLLLETILKQERTKKIGILKYLDLENIDFTNQNIILISFIDTNANIDPQKVQDKDLEYTKLFGDFNGKSFDNTNICGADFSNAKNVHINPQKIKGKKIINADVTNVDFGNHSFEGVETKGTDFSNSKNCELTQNLFYKYKKKILEIK